MFTMALKFIKLNLTKGRFTWNGYVANNRPDAKFGYNVFDYLCQVPVLGIVFLLWVEVLYILARPIFWLFQKKETALVKS